MHIKNVIISGFRSFRSQGEVSPFDSGHNALVGRNGSGKSNFFDAIQFCLLAPKFVNLRQEERQSLLHEGAGASVMSAFVEIVFDNSDGRLSVEGDEVVLRRTIGLKKDEFFLNRKRVNRSEVQSLLESAGFSKSNPYYIVQQGKVNALCMMKDDERLDLLKEVAGTTVYDEKRTESERQMESNKGDRSKINEVITYIEERLSELESEKEELTAYQKLDRSRRAIEYTLYDKELRRARSQLDDLEHARAEDADRTAELHEQARETHDMIRGIERQMKQATAASNKANLKLKKSEEELTEHVTKRTQLELETAELKSQTSLDANSQKAMKKELSDLEKKIKEANKKMTDMANPAYEKAKRALDTTFAKKNDIDRQAESLYAKQGRAAQFDNEQARDEFLEASVKELQATISDREGEIASLEDTLAALRRTIDNDKSELKLQDADISKKQTLLKNLSTQLSKKSEERNKYAEDRSERWRALEELNDNISEEKENLARAQSDLRKAMPRNTALGLAALKDIVAKENTEGYYGTVIDNFKLVDDKFRTAVEVSCGNSLFHVIVDTDETAAKLMTKLETNKLGRVTFMPLDKLRYDKNISYPESNDVVPIIKRCIKFDAKVAPAMAMIFGKKLLAKNLDAASEWSKNANMDAVTMDGDEVNRKGALQGGFIDEDKSKLASYDSMKKSEDKLDKLKKDHDDLQKKATAVDQRISNLMGEMQKMEAKKANLRHILEQTAKENQSKKERGVLRLKSADTQGEALPAMRLDVEGLNNQILRLQDEIGTPLSSELNPKERATLASIRVQQKDLEASVDEQSTVLEQAYEERTQLTALLEDNLLRRQSELNDSLNTSSFDSLNRTLGAEINERKEELESKNQDLEIATKCAEAAEQRIAEAKAITNKATTALTTCKASLEELKAKDAVNKSALEESTESAERLLNKRSMGVSKRELYMRKIQDLGSIPSTELGAHTENSIKELMKKLDTCNKKLKKYSHVNKKAYDQYVNFSDQRENLIERKKELDTGAVKVKELIESLDKQKDEAINRTFRGVSAHFKDVFQELCPDGSGELIMRTALDEDDEEVNNDNQNMEVSLFRGVSVKVRFSNAGENYLMSQLSGGQKALVAMALIFAIQRCDPAPFYLFDELDQALDSTHRAAVAALISKQAASEENPTQFITSTFRPELVQVASRCYGISHQNKVSNVHMLTKKDSLSFISNLMSEEEAVGDVQSVAPSVPAEKVEEAETSVRVRKGS